MIISKDDLAKLETQVTEILKSAGALLSKEWQNIKQVSFKAEGEPFTEMDVNIENIIRGELAELLPEAGFIVEEGQNTEEKELSWVIDPIDQTKNFIGQIPLFYTQVALIQNGSPILGAIYNPVSGQMFTASSGNGAKLNGAQIAKPIKSKLLESIVDIDFGGSDGIDWKIKALEAIANRAHRIRISSAALSPYLATVGIDALVVLSDKIKIVDVMPRIIIGREMGLVFERENIHGRQIYIAAEPSVFEEIKALLLLAF